MVGTDDLYKRLQVDAQAESEVIRAAYHALARKYHPDLGGDLQRMVEFNAAWAVLGNPVLRAAYDAERNQAATPAATVAPAEPHGNNVHAGYESPPRNRRDSSSTLDFGRYAGWSLGQVAEKDPDYLEWMIRTPIGRRLSAEVIALLEVRAAARSGAGLGRRGPQGGPLAGRRDRASAGRQWFGRARQSY